MGKTRTSDGDGYKTVHSELSRDGYVTTYDVVALPNYLVHLPSLDDVVVDIDVDEELNERGNCGDSYYGGDDARDFGDTMRGLKLERSRIF